LAVDEANDLGLSSSPDFLEPTRWFVRRKGLVLKGAQEPADVEPLFPTNLVHAEENLSKKKSSQVYSRSIDGKNFVFLYSGSSRLLFQS
jgi:hypothetical protein